MAECTPCEQYKLDMSGTQFGASDIAAISLAFPPCSALSLYISRLLWAHFCTCFCCCCPFCMSGACANCGQPKFKHSKAAQASGKKASAKNAKKAINMPACLDCYSCFFLVLSHADVSSSAPFWPHTLLCAFLCREDAIVVRRVWC